MHRPAGGLNADNRDALYWRKNGTLSRVISVDDALFGSTVTSVDMENDSLDGNSLAFRYSLADGRTGIGMATVPEPGTLAILLLGGTLVLVRRRRH